MTKKQYRNQLRTKSWAAFRQKVLEYYGKECIICGGTKRLQAHHKWYIDGRKAWQYSMDDMAIMCKGCHESYHEEHLIKIYDKNLKLKFRKKYD